MSTSVKSSQAASEAATAGESLRGAGAAGVASAAPAAFVRSPALPPRSDTGYSGPSRFKDDDADGGADTLRDGDDQRAAPGPMPVLEGYQIVSRLGTGGMGTVWRAWQLSTRREVALKLLKSGVLASERAKLRFDREVEVTGRLQHPNLARVYDSGIYQGVYFYAMELIEGVPLDQYVRQQELDRRATIKLVITISRAMQHAHQRGVIHRDLKPSNILVDASGEPHVVDFGLGKSIEGTNGSNSSWNLLGGNSDVPPPLTVEGEWAGTPLYMSPEQAAGKVDQLDTRTDVYSLGVMLYHLLTGSYPHDPSGGSLKVLRRLVDEDVIRPRQASADIDIELDALLLKALSRNPDDRYTSAGALAEDLENYLQGEPLSARAPTAFYFMRKKLRKHRMPLALAAAVLVGVVSLAVHGSVRVAKERDFATASARSESELRAIAEIRLGESFAGWGEALAAEHRWDEAAAKFDDARVLLQAHKINPVAADLGLLNVYQHVPQPLVEFASSDFAFAKSGRSNVALGQWAMAVGFDGGGRSVVSVDASGMTTRRALPPTGGASQQIPPPDGMVVLATYMPRDAKHAMRVVAPAKADAPGEPMLDQAVLERVDLQAGAAQARVPLRADTIVTTRAISPDGRALADIISLAPEAEDAVHQLLVYEFAEKDGGAAGEVTTRVIAERRELAGLSGLAYSGDGKRLVAAGAGGRVMAWDVASGRTLDVQPLRVGGAVVSALDVRRVAAGPTNGVFVASSNSGAVALWNPLERHDVIVLDRGGPGTPEVEDCSFSPDGRQVSAVDAGGRARVWDVATGTLTHAVEAHPGGATRLNFSPDSRLLATTGADGAVRLWPVRNEIAGRALRVQPAGGMVTCLVLSPDGRMAATGHENRVVELIDVATGRLLKNWTLQWPVASLAFTPDAATLLASTSQSSVYSLAVAAAPANVPEPFRQDAPRPLPLGDPDMLNPGVNAFSPDGTKAVHFSARGAGLWDVSAGRMLRVLDPRPTEAACFVPPGPHRGTHIVAAILDGRRELVAFDRAGQILRKIEIPVRGRVNAIAASSEGHLVIVGDDAGDVHALDLGTWQWTWAMHAHSGAATSLAFAPDGRTILSGGADGALLLCDAGVGRPLHTLARGQAAVRAAQFSTDAGCVVATLGDGRTTRLWDVAFGREFSRNAKAAREFTRRGDGASFAERLRVAEWFLLQGQPNWARQAVTQESPEAADSRSQAAVARILWSADDAAGASSLFSAALARNNSAFDQPYLTLCRDAAAAAGGEP